MRTIDESLAAIEADAAEINQAVSGFTAVVQDVSDHCKKVGYATNQRLNQIYERWRDEELIGASLPDVVEFVSSWMTPAEVFSETALIKWAENYGYRMPTRRFEE
jgi:hypothetical protein